jgi:hypothetical protein
MESLECMAGYGFIVAECGVGVQPEDERMTKCRSPGPLLIGREGLITVFQEDRRRSL